MTQCFRNRLKDLPPVNRVWSAFRRAQHNRIIEREQREYERRARTAGIPIEEEPVSETFRRLNDRLAQRGLKWPPERTDGRLHIGFCTYTSTATEQVNIAPELERIGKVSSYFLDLRVDSRGLSLEATREFVDRDLFEFVQAVHKERPLDMLLSYLSGSHISADAIRRINDLGIPTFLFHLDDRLYFRGRKSGNQWTGPADVCSAYDMNLTNAPASLIKYRVEGGLALFWPGAANRDLCAPRPQPFKYDVSFIGAKYGRRPLLIDRLRRNGIRVECFGPGWPNGPLTTDEMIDVYARSRINLGFGYVGYSDHQCLKGRDFEVPMCGALYLTTHNEDLRRVYRIGEEIMTFRDGDDCLNTIGELLADPDRCNKMRPAARRACLKRHTREARVRALLECRPAVPEDPAGEGSPR
jgi:hypothetical protein